MAEIHLATEGQRLFTVTRPKIASGDKNLNYLRVSFCPNWDGFVKTAIFYRNKKDAYYAVLNDENTCLIPWEVLQTNGILYLGIIGVSGDIRKTSEVISYRIAKGAIVDDSKPSDPAPDIYNQILANYNSIAQSVENARTKIDEHIEDKNNPHAITSDKIGAAPATHVTDKNNPHGVTADLIGAAPATHVNDTNNPHKVTKSQVGLSEVPNVSTNDQTPTFTIASVLANLASGEKLSVAFGNYDLCDFDTDYLPITKVDGTPLFDEAELETIDAYATARTELVKAKAAAKKEAAQNTINEPSDKVLEQSQ